LKAVRVFLDHPIARMSQGNTLWIQIRRELGGGLRRFLKGGVTF
jgi:hypothetical protein